MGYYATGGGSIDFKAPLSGEAFQQVDNIVRCWFDVMDYYKNNRGVDLCFDGKYTFSLEEDLNRLASIAPISSGSLEFTGEDGEHWKFKYDPYTGRFEEFSARLIYEDEAFLGVNDCAEFIGQIIDTFEDFLEEKVIDIPNEDKEQSENPAIIYGMDYGRLQSELEGMMYNWKILKPEP